MQERRPHRPSAKLRGQFFYFSCAIDHYQEQLSLGHPDVVQPDKSNVGNRESEARVHVACATPLKEGIIDDVWVQMMLKYERIPAVLTEDAEPFGD